MIYCRKCGAANRDESDYCRSCGEKLRDNVQADKHSSDFTQQIETSNLQQSQVLSSFEESQNVAQNKPVNKKKLIGFATIIALVAIVIGIACFVLTLPPKADISKYITITYNGMSPDATAEISVDWNGFQKEYGSELAFTDEAKTGYGVSLSFGDPLDYVKEMVSVSLDKTEGLSEGDELTYTYTVNDNLAEIVDVRMESGEGTCTVEGLDSYIETLDDLKDNDLEKLKMAAGIHFEDGSQYFSTYNLQIESFDYIGAELLTLKDPTVNPNDESFNHLCLVYKVIAHCTAEETSSYYAYDRYVTYYWYCQFDGVAINSDGDCVTDVNGYVITPEGNFSIEQEGTFREWLFYGFQTLDELDDETQLLTYYNVESSVDPDAGAETKNSGGAIEKTDSEENDIIGKATVKVSKLRIRDKASTSGNKVGYVKKGKTYDVYETKTSGGYTWYRIGDDQWIADDGTWITYKSN